MASRLIRVFDDQAGEVPVQVGDPNPQSPPQLLSGYAGGSASLIKGSGNMQIGIVSAGSNPAGTAADYVLAVLNIPAGFFDAANRGLNILAQGSVVSNVNSKTLKLIVGATAPAVGAIVSGGTTIASLVTNTTAGSGGWQLEGNIYKYGLAGSNTQIALHAAGQAGNVVAALVAPSLLTLAENAAQTIAVTGNAATAATDIVFNFAELYGLN